MVCKSLRTTLSTALNFLNGASYLACFSWADLVACRWVGDQGQAPPKRRWTAWRHSESWIVSTSSWRNKYKYCSCTVHISSFGNCVHALTTLQMTAKPTTWWYNVVCCIWRDQREQLSILFDTCHLRRCKLLGFRYRKSVLPLYCQCVAVTTSFNTHPNKMPISCSPIFPSTSCSRDEIENYVKNGKIMDWNKNNLLETAMK